VSAAGVVAASKRIGGMPTGEFEVGLASLRRTAALGRLSRVALRCLIVDDSEAFLASASRLLCAQGLEVVAGASSGEEALRLTRQLQPDVALVDVQLGGEDGLGVAQRLAANAQATRVILISSHSKDELGELVADSPAVGFLPKSALGADAIARLLCYRASR
jgi:DNA-binding NarL/FixJ family response regulator